MEKPVPEGQSKLFHLTLPGGGWPWGLENTTLLPGPLKLLNSVFKLSLKVSKETPVLSSLFVGQRVSVRLGWPWVGATEER